MAADRADMADAAPRDISPQGAGPSMRVDKWLWHARFFKSRSLATAMVSAGRLRIDRQPVSKAHALVRPGSVLTFPKGDDIRVIEVLAIAKRRGPAAEARLLYSDLDPPGPRIRADKPPPPPGARDRGAGRPTKRERRETDRLRR